MFRLLESSTQMITKQYLNKLKIWQKTIHWHEHLSLWVLWVGSCRNVRRKIWDKFCRHFINLSQTIYLFKRRKIDCFDRILVYILTMVWPVHWVDGFWGFKCSIWVFILFNLSWVLALIQPRLVSDFRFNPVRPPVLSGFKILEKRKVTGFN